MKTRYILFIIFATFIAPNIALGATSSASIIIFGDMMFDRGVRNTINKYGSNYIWNDAPNLIKTFDISIANLEGPITPYPSRLVDIYGKRISRALEFTFPTSTARDLNNNGIDVVSLANNHTLNFGQDGLNLTRSYLNDNNVKYFGSPKNSFNISTSTCVNNICIGLIGYHEFAYQNDNKIIKEIKKLKNTTDYIIVYPHWGVEYKTAANQRQRKLAREWIDNGADAVIGSHPHVIEDYEFYNNKPIYYSLGNFIFDQYFSYNTTHGLALELNLVKDKETVLSKIVEHEFSNKDYSIKFGTTTERQTPVR